MATRQSYRMDAVLEADSTLKRTAVVRHFWKFKHTGYNVIYAVFLTTFYLRSISLWISA